MKESQKAFNRFKQTWEKEINKIEIEALDTRGVFIIYNHFHIDLITLHMSMSEHEFTMKMHQEATLLESKLSRALEVARTKYSLKNKGLWIKFIEGISKIVYRAPKSLDLNKISS